MKSVLLFSYGSFAAWIYTRIIHFMRSAQVRQLLSVGYMTTLHSAAVNRALIIPRLPTSLPMSQE